MNPFEKNWTDSFKVAYNHLVSNSIKLTQSDNGKAEVYETGTTLLTIVLLDRAEFWTKTRLELGDEKYEECRNKFMVGSV